MKNSKFVFQKKIHHTCFKKMASDFDDFESKEKNRNNTLLALWVKRYLTSVPRTKHIVRGLDKPFTIAPTRRTCRLSDRYALILDGPESRTSRKLIEMGVSSPHMIYTPQLNKEDAKKMRKNLTSNVYQTTLTSAIHFNIRLDIIRQMSIFYLDFMGSVFGRERQETKTGKLIVQEIYPLSDFHDCLKMTDSQDVVIAMTVCDRMGAKITKDVKLFEGRKNFGEQIDEDFLRQIIHLLQYRVVKSYFYSYQRGSDTASTSHVPTTPTGGRGRKGTRISAQGSPSGKTAKMWFFIYYLKKDLRINPEKAEIPISPFNRNLFWGFNPAFKDSKVSYHKK